MSLIVQNDEGTVANANGYITLDEFKAYHDARGNDYSTHLDPAIEVAVVRATDYIDRRFRFYGATRNQEQTTEWPRRFLWHRNGQLVQGLPLELKQATSEYAFRALTAALLPDPNRDASGRNIKQFQESVDGVVSRSVTYAGEGMAFVMPEYPLADELLRKAGFLETGTVLLRA